VPDGDTWSIGGEITITGEACQRLIRLAETFVEEIFEKAIGSDANALETFQRAIDAGHVKIHPVFGMVACPECYAPLSEMDEKVYGDDRVTVLSATCPRCGWSDHSEV
jgi:RNase P subunit RPR2